ncbi:Sec-independent protein translocase protein TatB [Quisquiliibacterium transsilvanicum]|jgi:sec-independent protein translocase protein TatB|uniref:Sec-independent protein translocase protein TatB n=1 Tax=Quisquiliibacterium transsilvanicum TaxID=1549638 RepID=A0A7W8HJJ7_9BURK|nr:Sec-independent protein translocase protein TatB [Quisquiliibacterium transsilvanicum]MBB5273067.1 sec-independent protein translocase protein TatB [Quisquiliibacterium transsilvanicum]
MFDIGFSEMAIIAVVGLVVLGPERLPKVARQLGQWLGKLQRYVSDVKSDISRQMELEELRKLQGEMKDAASGIEDSFRSSVSEARSEFDSIASSVEGGSGQGASAEPATDWDRVYAARRARQKIADRRQERARALGQKRPKRP